MSSESGDAGGSAGDSDGVVTLLLYIVFVYPTCSWILSPKRKWPRKQAIIYAICFLAAIAVGKLALEWADRGPNHYHRLGVERSAPGLEIKKAYKKISLELHPDKNPSPEAAEEFTRMKNAYDVLMDLEMREIYDKLGPEAIRANKRMDETQLLLEMAIFYVSWGVMSYVLTLGKSSADARSWTFTGLIVMLVAEVSIIFSGQGSILPKWFLPQMTDHELVHIMHGIFPAFMNGCRAIGGFLYVDVEKQTRDMLLELREGHKAVCLQLRQLQIAIGSGGGGNMGSHGSAGSSAASKTLTTTPAEKLRELEQRSKMNMAGVDRVASEIRADSATQAGSNNRFWWFLLAYAAFYYFFQ
jgi:hypothetical protein